MREDVGNCLKYLKGRWAEKSGGETKTLKRGGGKLGQGVDALKRKAAGTPLPTMLYFFGDVFIVYYSL